jgi:single-strand DNA-binding protein
MADLNQVMMIGRLARDAELKYTAEGTAVCKMSLAVNRKKKSGDTWVDEASFFEVVLWGRQGEALKPYLIKGKQVGVAGELRQDRWEQDGQNRSKVQILANSIQLLGGKSDNGGGDHGGSGYSNGGNRSGGNSYGNRNSRSGADYGGTQSNPLPPPQSGSSAKR